MEIVYKVLNSLSSSKLLVPLGEGGTGWVEGVKMWWKDVGQCEGGAWGDRLYSTNPPWCDSLIDQMLLSFSFFEVHSFHILS